ncbi:MAG: hypothetical protein AAFN70_16280, partial [Planctomycetota bacterium]
MKVPDKARIADVIEVADGIHLRTDFPSGAVRFESFNAETGALRVHPIQDDRFGLEAWWHFQLEGSLPVPAIDLQIIGGSSRGGVSWAQPARIAYSATPEKPSSWRLAVRGNRVMSNGIQHVSYRVPVRGDVLAIAYALPYVPANQRRLFLDLGKLEPKADFMELSRTPEDHPVMAVTLPCTSAKPTKKIWVQARAHAFESGASWVSDSLARWLVSDDRPAVMLRAMADITIVPIIDVDSVIEGRSGKMQKPRDHARDWDDQPLWSATRGIMAALERESGEAALDLFIDIHGPGRSAMYAFVTRPDKLAVPNADRAAFFIGAGMQPWPRNGQADPNVFIITR